MQAHPRPRPLPAAAARALAFLMARAVPQMEALAATAVAALTQPPARGIFQRHHAALKLVK
eukprot:5135269-Lingulodinium_polyedra.AAC.1